jgi:hypothetical protein
MLFRTVFVPPCGRVLTPDVKGGEHRSGHGESIYESCTTYWDESGEATISLGRAFAMTSHCSDEHLTMHATGKGSLDYLWWWWGRSRYPAENSLQREARLQILAISPAGATAAIIRCFT